MLTRKHRFLVGSVSSLVWPAITLLVPMGITFAAARVYAEAAQAPERCDAAVVIECADAAVNSPCHSCTGGTCACAATSCDNGAQFENGKTCVVVPKCEDYKSDPPCEGKQVDASCQISGSSAPAMCAPASESACLPNDGGPAFVVTSLSCKPAASSTSSSSSGDNGGSSGSYIPGPPTVPGSSGASSTPAPSDDSGCATSSSTTLPLFAAPLALGLLFALRGKKKKKR